MRGKWLGGPLQGIQTEYLGVPTQSGGVVFHAVLPRPSQQTDERANQPDTLRIQKHVFIGDRKRVTPDTLALRTFDQLIGVEQRLFLDILHEQPRLILPGKV